MLQPFKIEYFKRKFPDREFPRLTDLAPSDADQLRDQIARRYMCEVDKSDHRALTTQVTDRMSLLSGSLHARGEPDLAPTPLCGSDSEFCYLCFDDLETFQRMLVEELVRNFEWIWYGPSDDLLIVNEACDWIVLVDYAGATWMITAPEIDRSNDGEVG